MYSRTYEKIHRVSQKNGFETLMKAVDAVNQKVRNSTEIQNAETLRVKKTIEEEIKRIENL